MWSLWRSKPNEEADRALKDANRNLRAVKRRSEEVTQVSNALKDLYERNHFAETLEAIIIRHKGPLNDA